MAKDDDKPAQFAKAVLHSVRLREVTQLAPMTTEQSISPYEQPSYEVIVQGAQVFIALPENVTTPAKSERALEALGAERVRQVVEVPRSACVLRWFVPAGTKGADIVKAIQSNGASTLHVAPVGAK